MIPVLRYFVIRVINKTSRVRHFSKLSETGTTSNEHAHSYLCQTIHGL